MTIYWKHCKIVNTGSTFPSVTSMALIGVSLIVLPLLQLLSVGCVNNSLPSMAKRTSS